MNTTKTTDMRKLTNSWFDYRLYICDDFGRVYLGTILDCKVDSMQNIVFNVIYKYDPEAEYGVVKVGPDVYSNFNIEHTTKTITIYIEDKSNRSFNYKIIDNMFYCSIICTEPTD